ncbi:hypothetical protein scyTo_0024719 [Scyliorhinus torazame]|uniref:Talin central domain-containing protein n=1 Tax=Scyliorhinus torazame TaxID=75743 RepID=A0A401QEZ9_SCYTO|nr:hypothetical protein [Scyliorhinus torazame]
MGTMPAPQQQILSGQMHRGHMPPLTSAQQALMGTINSSMQAVQQAHSDLTEIDNLPPLGQDMVSLIAAVSSLTLLEMFVVLCSLS